MGSFAALLLGLSGSLAARVLTTLGIGFLSYKGLEALATKVKNMVIQSFDAIDPDLLNLMNLAGLGQVAQILCAALITKAALMAIKKLGALAT